ncbi:tetratricopeptide repeat protein [Flavobacteriaceae bacterium D16]|nr:tetratricopeptide repeat protein [Flavobacteriaceae bacterium D16]
MNRFRLLFCTCLIFSLYQCQEQPSQSLPANYQVQVLTDAQKEIVEEHLKKGAWKNHMYSQQWQEEIDKGLAKDSTIAYLWQQKAMPLFKQGKYEIGMEYIDKAVNLDRRSWQDYRAFIKCIFAKTYRDAIIDFLDCKEQFGNGYVMDHSYDFYIALSYLQLNEFEKAEQIFKNDYNWVKENKGKDWLHHLDLFYYGVSKYEQKKYQEAIDIFDQTLEIYPDFSEVQIFKAHCLRDLGKLDEAKKLYDLGESNGRLGNTINEDNVIYERYPYQFRWR